MAFDGAGGEPWRKILAESVVSKEALHERLQIPIDTMAPVIDRYPMRINPYFLSLIKSPDDPIARQVVPDSRELDANGIATDDPLTEGAQSPVDSLVHRYPDRVLFLVSGQCAVYCRHCMRKRNAGVKPVVHSADVDRVAAYIRRDPAIKEVILSGGDPLLLPDGYLDAILQRMKGISHVQRLRIHTRAPCVLPQRITGGLVDILKRYPPLYVNIQFNHPDELTPEAVRACEMLVNAGIVLGSQTVLLKGVNDDPGIMLALMEKLLACRVRPYYLHHPDPVRGTTHFRIPPETGLGIMKALRGRISGMGIPQYVMDLPGGGGKIPVVDGCMSERADKRLIVNNYEGKPFIYPL